MENKEERQKEERQREIIERMVEGDKQEATKVQIMANRVAFKAQRIAGFIEGQRWRDAIERESKGKFRINWLGVLFHDVSLREAEKHLDKLCDMYDKLQESDFSAYHAITLKPLLEKMEKKNAQKVESEKAKKSR